MHIYGDIFQFLENYDKLRKEKGLEKDGLILPAKIAECYYYLSQQHRSTWTNEIDLRSFSDAFLSRSCIDCAVDRPQ